MIRMLSRSHSQKSYRYQYSHRYQLSLLPRTNLKLSLTLITLEHIQNVAPPDQIVNLLSRKSALLEQALQPRELLLHVSRVLLALLGNLAVVLGILLLGAANSLRELLLRFGAAAAQRADNLVERGNRAGEGVQTAACDAEGAGFLVQEGDEVGFRAARVVGNCFGGAGWVVLDGRVGLDAGFLCGGLSVGGFAVDFGDEDVGLRSEIGGELFPDGGEGFAVCKFNG